MLLSGHPSKDHPLVDAGRISNRHLLAATSRMQEASRRKIVDFWPSLAAAFETDLVSQKKGGLYPSRLEGR